MLTGTLSVPVYSATDDSCSGPSALLAIVNRPNGADSVCVVPSQRAVLEMGWQYLQLVGTGYSYNLPEMQFRVSVPGQNELSVFLPNYNSQTIPLHSGVAATTIGIKHQFTYSGSWVSAVEALITAPSGSAALGSPGWAGTFNGILAYSLTPAVELTFMLGVGSQVLPNLSGGQRYASVNPDFVVSWEPQEQYQFYGEVYGQSSTGPGTNPGFNMDIGILYLLTQNMEVDFSVGQRLIGQLDGFDHYLGVGMAVLF
ncbi:MAG: hypothetical protein A3E84_04860 [Gammaproteobacteria bacterium RIFCSPHIGHO2_12_FULL_42_13]|nr:MAG: hypothetical protein A3E84_04860 [Gammaproteobacteria bacterium RIFCSPHIGHO2_12_FULL_42_13]